MVNFGLQFNAFVNALAIDPQDSNVIYASLGSGILRSADGGASWADANSGSPLFNVRALTIDSKNPGNVYAGNPDGVFELTFVP
jgi:hypothetical protein